MTPAFANEKLVIDLKAVLEDIHAVCEIGAVDEEGRRALVELGYVITRTAAGRDAYKEFIRENKGERQ